MLKRNRAYFENMYFGGDAFPQVFLNMGVAGHAGYFRNARYLIGDTVWFFPSLKDWKKDALEFDPESLLYRRTVELARFLVAEAKGDFFVSMPDNTGNADALAHLRGSEDLLVDMMEESEEVQSALDRIQEVWRATSETIYQITRENNDGGSCIGWLDTWAPGRHAQMQCDLSVMISEPMFRQFIRPELEAQGAWLDQGLYHLDGSEQLRHLDVLLSVPGIRAIQWTQVDEQPSVLSFIPELQRIQRAGRGVVVIASPEQVEPLLQALSPRGLLLKVFCETEEEAHEVEKQVERSSSNRFR